MTCDLLVFAPHPDDAELYCGGIIAHHVQLGHRVVVVDATRGELGSRGTVAGRATEAESAAAVLGVHARENLGLPDGHLHADNDEQRQAVVASIRTWKPQLVLCIHPHARHPDHQALGQLVPQAVKLAGIHNYHPDAGPAHQGARCAWYEAELPLSNPQFLVPCSDNDWERKREALRCHASQFGLDHTPGPPTAISQPDFLEWIDHRARTWGYLVNAPFAEAGAAPEPLILPNLLITSPVQSAQ